MYSNAAAIALEFTYGYKAQQNDVVIDATMEQASSTLVGRMSPEMASLSHKFPICRFSSTTAVDGERSIPFFLSSSRLHSRVYTWHVTQPDIGLEGERYAIRDLEAESGARS